MIHACSKEYSSKNFASLLEGSFFVVVGVLHDELRTRPPALHHLSKFLKEHYDYTELTELYRWVLFHEECAEIVPPPFKTGMLICR